MSKFLVTFGASTRSGSIVQCSVRNGNHKQEAYSRGR